MYRLLDEILNSDDAGSIHAVHLNLKAHIECIKVHQKRIKLESNLNRVENELKLIVEQSKQ